MSTRTCLRPPLPPLLRPCGTGRRVGIARPPALVVPQRAGDPGLLSGITPLSVAAADMASATTVSSNGGTCATAAIGTTAVLAAALLALCVRVRVAVATTTAGDDRAPLGRPWAPLPGRQGARHSPPTTLVGALGARRLVVLPARRGLRRRVLPQARQEVRPISWGGRDNYRPRSPPRQLWGPPPGPPQGDWRSPRGDGWDRPCTLPRRPAGPPPSWRWAPSCEAWGDDQVPTWEASRPAPLWRVPDTPSPWRVDQYGDLGDTQELQWVLTQTPTRSTSSPWTWWPAPSQPLRQPTSAEPLSRPVYVLQGNHPSVDPTYQLVPVPRRPPQLFPAHPPPPYRL